MYVDGKLLKGIKSMYVNILVCISVKGGERVFQNWQWCETRLYYVPLVLQCNVYKNVVMKEVKMGIGRMGVVFLEEVREWRLPGISYADDFVLYGESEQDLKVMVEEV